MVRSQVKKQRAASGREEGPPNSREPEGALNGLSGYRTKTALVYAELREAILSGGYPPGARIVFDQVAAQLGVSKVPVREAVVQLVGEGWLTIRPHVGAVVPELNAEEIIETSVIRAVLEGAAVRSAVNTISEETLTSLARMQKAMDKAAAANNPEYPQLNREFHAALLSACPYPQLQSMALSLLDRSRRWRIVRFLPNYLPDSQSEHEAILNAIEDRDGVLAERLIRRHIEHAGRLLWEYARKRQG